MIKIGSLKFDSNLFLAPLAGYTNLGFRVVVKRIGHLAMTTTDLINSRALIEQNPKTQELLKTCPEDWPLRVQIFGGDVDEVARAAQWLENYGAAAIDINMGCPVDKVIKCGAGSALTCDRHAATQFAQKVVAAVKIPVTVKMRLGWDDQNIVAPQLAAAFEDVGVASITIHGRTRAQGFSGKVNLDGIRQVVQAVKHIPVIGNGDILRPEHAKRMLDETGCAGLMIGRGALVNPWIFRDIATYLATGQLLPYPPVQDRLNLMHELFHTMIEQFGEHQACLKFRKIGIRCAKIMPNGKEFHRHIVAVTTKAHYDEIVAKCITPFLNMDNIEAYQNLLQNPQLSLPVGPNSMW